MTLCVPYCLLRECQRENGQLACALSVNELCVCVCVYFYFAGTCHILCMCESGSAGLIRSRVCSVPQGLIA